MFHFLFSHTLPTYWFVSLIFFCRPVLSGSAQRVVVCLVGWQRWHPCWGVKMREYYVTMMALVWEDGKCFEISTKNFFFLCCLPVLRMGDSWLESNRLSLSSINYSPRCWRISFDLTSCQKQALCSLLSRWPDFTRSMAFFQNQMFMVICPLNPHAAGFYIRYNEFSASILIIYQHSNHCTEQLVHDFRTQLHF